MTRVDFYVLAEERADADLRHACVLAEQAAAQGRRVYLRTSSAAETQRLDELLWTYSDGSFLPHEIYSGAPPAHERVLVLLGESPGPESHRGLLVNLCGVVPEQLDMYEAIAEIVPADAQGKRAARERYRLYRERGCTLESRNV